MSETRVTAKISAAIGDVIAKAVSYGACDPAEANTANAAIDTADAKLRAEIAAAIAAARAEGAEEWLPIIPGAEPEGVVLVRTDIGGYRGYAAASCQQGSWWLAHKGFAALPFPPTHYLRFILSPDDPALAAPAVEVLP